MDKVETVFQKWAQLKITPTYRLAGKLHKRFPGMGKRRALSRAKKIKHVMKPRWFEAAVPTNRRMDILQKYIKFEGPLKATFRRK